MNGFVQKPLRELIKHRIYISNELGHLCVFILHLNVDCGIDLRLYSTLVFRDSVTSKPFLSRFSFVGLYANQNSVIFLRGHRTNVEVSTSVLVRKWNENNNLRHEPKRRQLYWYLCFPQQRNPSFILLHLSHHTREVKKRRIDQLLTVKSVQLLPLFLLIKQLQLRSVLDFSPLISVSIVNLLHNQISFVNIFEINNELNDFGHRLQLFLYVLLKTL